jgi:hypothetical protein
MNAPQNRQRADKTSRTNRSSISFGNKPPTSYMPRNWRDRLRLPLDYYRQHVANLSAPDSTGMATGDCPLCADRGGTFVANVGHPRGHWRCDAGCGEGDMIAFAQRMFGLTFQQAVRSLIVRA